MRLVSLVSGLALLAACNDPDAPLSVVRVHDLGPGQFMVTCVDSPGYCAEQARASCPSGFDVVSNTTNPADYGRMTMVIRCL